MANLEHLKILQEGGVAGWNKWRAENPGVYPNLSDITIYEVMNIVKDKKNREHRQNLSGINFSNTLMAYSNFEYTDFIHANFSNANLAFSNFRHTDFSNSILTDGMFHEADFYQANFSNADLSRANLVRTGLVEANFCGANLQEASIYGISAWTVITDENTIQKDLQIVNPSDSNAPRFTCDNIDVAQFLHLILNNSKIRSVLNTLTSKVVLILGRFTPERKKILVSLKEALQKHDYTPVIFDFDIPQSRTVLETIKVLAGMSKFIIADLSEPQSTPLETHAIVPDFMVPFVAIIRTGEKPVSMYSSIREQYHWALAAVSYENVEELIKIFDNGILARALDKYSDIQNRRRAISDDVTPMANFQ